MEILGFRTTDGGELLTDSTTAGLKIIHGKTVGYELDGLSY
jgi:hypothetical protein